MKNGQHHSEESKIKISKSCKQRNVGKWMKGKKLSKETKKKISETCRMKGIGKWMLGKKASEETKNKMRLSLPKGKKHYLWKGDDVSYSGVHHWIRRKRGTPKYCEHCKRTDKKSYDWANIDHKYSRNPDDYIRLCKSCHRYFDQLEEEDYRRCMGLDSEDVGSRTLLARHLSKKFKKTTGLWKLPKNQLLMIMKKV